MPLDFLEEVTTGLASKVFVNSIMLHTGLCVYCRPAPKCSARRGGGGWLLLSWSGAGVARGVGVSVIGFGVFG